MFGMRATERLQTPPMMTPGRRVYAIGDIHGEIALLRNLLGLIQIDNEQRARRSVSLVVLGDFIDRGPASAEVVDLLYRMQTYQANVTVLKGNHEAMLLAVLDGDYDMLDLWLDYGGREALVSWGIDSSLMDADRMRELSAALRSAIPARHVKWLRGLPNMVRMGDYYFVHAGIRPGTSLGRQLAKDMLWIREPFLDSKADHGPIIVHGHSVVEDGPLYLPNRIAIDTGAYRTGRLSAVGFEDGESWSLSTKSERETVRTEETGSPSDPPDCN